MSIVTAEPFGMPSVSEVHESTDGSGLEVSGWFATWHEDSESEAFLPRAFQTAIVSAMAVGLPVLYHHRKNEAPIGFVKTCEERPGGLWGSVILPKPAVGTKAYDIYESVKAKLLVFFSVGGLWSRTTIGGKVMLGCKRLLEVSLTSCPSNIHAQASGVASVVGVKAVDGLWVPADLNGRVNRAVAVHRLEDIEHGLALADLRLDVAGLLLAN